MDDLPAAAAAADAAAAAELATDPGMKAPGLPYPPGLLKG